jgi:hypothetical protein
VLGIEGKRTKRVSKQNPGVFGWVPTTPLESLFLQQERNIVQPNKNRCRDSKGRCQCRRWNHDHDPDLDLDCSHCFQYIHYLNPVSHNDSFELESATRCVDRLTQKNAGVFGDKNPCWQ